MVEAPRTSQLAIGGFERKVTGIPCLMMAANVVNDINRAESTFQRLAIQERSKFEIESSSNSLNWRFLASNRSKSTLSVVSFPDRFSFARLSVRAMCIGHLLITARR